MENTDGQLNGYIQCTPSQDNKMRGGGGKRWFGPSPRVGPCHWKTKTRREAREEIFFEGLQLVPEIVLPSVFNKD